MSDLADRIEALTPDDIANLWDDKLNSEVARFVGWKYKLREGFNVWQWYHPTNPLHIQVRPPNFLGSIDAAMSLVEVGSEVMIATP